MCEAKNFYLWLLHVIGLLGLLALCLWLALRPKEPTFTIIGFSVQNITKQNSSTAGDGNQDQTLTYTIAISNSNKDSSINYDDIFLIFYFGKDTVGESKIPFLTQGKDKSIQVIDHVDSSQKKIQETLSKDISNGNAELKLDLTTKLQYKTWGVKSKHHGINLHATIPVGPDGKISDSE